MRFLQSEHQDIQQAIQSAGFDPQDFSAVKRQGKLHLHYHNLPTPFKFFRKKSTQLNPEGKWTQQTVYHIYQQGKLKETEAWEAVMAAFREWLQSL